jgi:UDP-N-acetylglucosamine 4-epimerase
MQANLLAATTSHADKGSQVYNVALGDRTTLNDLFELIRQSLSNQYAFIDARPIYREERAGDVKHSQADTKKSAEWLGYRPTHSIVQGIPLATAWYTSHLDWL